MDSVNVGCIITRGICKIPKTRKIILVLGNSVAVSMSEKRCEEVVGKRKKCQEPDYTGTCEPLPGVGIWLPENMLKSIGLHTN